MHYPKDCFDSATDLCRIHCSIGNVKLSGKQFTRALSWGRPETAAGIVQRGTVLRQVRSAATQRSAGFTVHSGGHRTEAALLDFVSFLSALSATSVATEQPDFSA